MVTTKEISIICQGSIIPGITEKCLRSLKSAFPGAELILSTWEGSDVSGLDADKVVFSPDPGAFTACEVPSVPNNINRQLVSTQAGLTAAIQPYILKTRTDVSFENATFLSYFGKYDEAPSPYFKNRLLICNYYTRNPRVMALCFTPSDWIVFGWAEDVRKYYENSPLMTEEEGNWFRERKKASTFFTNYICRFTPEQHIFLGFLRQHESIECDCYYERTPVLVEQTEKALAECFVVLDYGRQLKISFSKYNPNRYLERFTLLSHRQWITVYRHYCADKKSDVWFFYRIKCYAAYLVANARTTCVKVLKFLGVKNIVKEILSFWRGRY